MQLVTHGDFNCPFSALASERAALAGRQRAWEDLDRAITPMMKRADGSVARGLEALDDLAELLATGATEPPS